MSPVIVSIVPVALIVSCLVIVVNATAICSCCGYYYQYSWVFKIICCILKLVLLLLVLFTTFLLVFLGACCKQPLKHYVEHVPRIDDMRFQGLSWKFTQNFVGFRVSVALHVSGHLQVRTITRAVACDSNFYLLRNPTIF